jgi:hypothetical protein
MSRTIYYACQFLFSFLILSGVLEGKNEQGKAFYAISSLRFYLDELTGDLPNDEELDSAILFEEADIAHLWSLATLENSFSLKLNEAQAYYQQAIENKNHPKQFTELCEKAKSILEEVWENVNHSFFENRPLTFLEEKKEFYNHQNLIYPNFSNNSAFTKEMRSMMRPYLLPLTHPLKVPLDLIFTQTRVIENEISFAQAGFITISLQPNSFIRIARHPTLPNHLLKVYLDSETRKKEGKPGWLWLTQRCQGAENIRNLIEKKKFYCFSVPNKWLYPLPNSSQFVNKKLSQPVVLVVTDMDLVSLEETVEAWLNKITPRHLDELYCILSHGYSSCFLYNNIPYSKSGKFSCIDTEHPKRKLDFGKINKYLSNEMQIYWNELVRKGGVL